MAPFKCMQRVMGAHEHEAQGTKSLSYTSNRPA